MAAPRGGETAATLGEGTWSVAADPRSIPNRFVSPDGQVDFLIQVTDPQTKAAAFHTVSALRVSHLTDGTVGLLRAGAAIPDGWVAVPGLPTNIEPTVSDTGTPTPPKLGEGDAGSDDLEVEETSVNAAVDLAELQGIPLEFLTAPSAVADDEGQAGDTSFLLATPAETDVSMRSSAPWNCREIPGYRRSLQTTIATAYPVGGDTSSLTYSASMNTTSGTATSFGGTWSESGTESTSDGWGADFLENTRRRSYRTVITYGYYACYNVAGYYSYWISPIKQPGDAYYYYLSSAQGSGPLYTVDTETGVVFPALQGNGLDQGTWSATAGSFLLCSATPDITIAAVEPGNASDAAAFTATVRQFTIADTADGTPVLGGYGTPPVIGGQDGSDQSHLTGTLVAAAGHTLEVPACEATAGTPGTDAVELLLTVRADEQGAKLDGVDVSYEADGRQHLLHIPVTMVLCGSEHRDRDC